jgi:UDP-2,4-diacetamido-2,4,6-trideoxy-beta-L-altropyranose hydrolase
MASMLRVENPGTLLIRADASAIIGSGHVMRCLALAQAWQDAGGKGLIAMAEATPAIEKTLRREGVEIASLNAEPGGTKDATSTTRLAEEHNAAWVVVDGYRFGSDYQSAVKSSGVRLLIIDDGANTETYAADLILNQNVHASPDLYSGRAPRSRLLLGPGYSMLRRQFAGWREWRREIFETGHRILVTMGGSDPDNYTLGVIHALETVSDEELEVVIVAGGSNPHFSGLETAISKLPRARLLRDAENMPELMAWADVAVSGAGTTCWEMCFLGLPALVVDLAPNQYPVARCLDEFGAIRHIGSSGNCSAGKIASELRWLSASAEVRRRMSERGRKLVDGRGASRVCAAMMGAGLRLRRASESDRRLLWEWANDAGVRASSFSQAEIGWEEHSRWFAEKLSDGSCLILIGEDAEQQPIGQVRFDQQRDGEAEIHVSVAPGSRGMGYGGALIDAAVRELSDGMAIKRVNAYIRRENLGSLRAFEKVGFRKVGEKNVRGTKALHYCRKLDEKH